MLADFEDAAIVLFRFRICHDPQLADQAQGWVVAGSELSARDLLGGINVHLIKQHGLTLESDPIEAVFLTEGALS